MPPPVYSGNPTITAASVSSRRRRCQPSSDLPAKPAVKQQILGWVPGERELGKQHEIGAEGGALACRVAAMTPRRALPCTSPTQEIQLRQRDPQ